MAVNTRFASGVHILILLAEKPKVLQTSTGLAGLLKTNPVVVRRLLSCLQRAQLIVSLKGPTGGSLLSKSPKLITLADIYKAVVTSSLFHSSATSNEHGARITQDLEKTFRSAERCVIHNLGSTTLAQFAKRADRPANKR